MMPDGNGFETLVALTKTPETANIPIIIVSIVDQKKEGRSQAASPGRPDFAGRSRFMMRNTRISVIDRCKPLAPSARTRGVYWRGRISPSS
jgi:CheY-like chemotaxis protein